MVLFHILIFGGQRLGAHVEQLFAIGRTHRDQLPSVISDPVLVFSLLIDYVEAMSAGEAMFPGRSQRPGLVICDEVVVGIVREQDDPALSILADAVAVLHRIFPVIQSPPQTMGAVT